jgi:hypothetical protein
MTSNNIRIITIQFSENISEAEIPYFRGCVNQALGKEADLLFHNHKDDKEYRYSYPLIQYKRIRQKAAIVCINEGVDVIGQFFLCEKTNYQIGTHNMNMFIENMTQDITPVCICQVENKYRIHRWQALNSKNYNIYIGTDSLTEKTTILENILKANILSFAKGLNITIDEQISVKLTYISKPYTTINKGIKFMTFNAEFTSNISLPDHIGLGKNASIGYGNIKKLYKPRYTQQQ